MLLYCHCRYLVYDIISIIMCIYIYIFIYLKSIDAIYYTCVSLCAHDVWSSHKQAELVISAAMWAQLRWSMGRNRSKMHFRHFLRRNFAQFIQMISNKSCFQWKVAIFWCSRITSKTPSSLNFKKNKNVKPTLSTGCHLGCFKRPGGVAELWFLTLLRIVHGHLIFCP